MAGRADELERLARLVDAGPGPAIGLVGGEAGVGKTRLVRELIDRLPEGMVVFAGQADPGSFGRPFELLFDALEVGPDATPTTASNSSPTPSARPTSASASRSRSCAT